jgi:transcriptional regulator with XRE-family HTH domain
LISGRRDDAYVATRETKADRGRRNGRDRATRLLSELREARLSADVSQRSLARALGWSHTRYCRFENDRAGSASVVELGAAAAVLGLKLSAGLYPEGEPLRDAGHQALIARAIAQIGPAWRVAREVPLPLAGDRRSWDVLLRLGDHLVGVEAETRIRDVQRLVRRIRERERDGGVDAIVILLSDSRVNRALVGQLREALGPEYATAPRSILRALREGQPLPGSGVVLV